MAQPVKTSALAAYVESRKMKFVGSLVTLRRLAQMLAISPEAIVGPTVDDAVLTRIAQYLKLPVAELVAHANAQVVTVPPTPAPAPAPKASPPPGVPALPMPQSVSETAVMQREQLADLVAKSRRSEPVITPPPATEPAPVITTGEPMSSREPGAREPAPEAAADDQEVTISFDDVEATPPPTVAELPVLTETKTEPKSDAKSGKSKSGKSKKR